MDPHGVGHIVVDVVGLGMYLADRMAELGYQVVRFNGGSTPRSRNYLNVRAESYWVTRQQLEAGTLDLPRDEVLFDELLAIKWRPTADGKVQLEAKLELKSRIGRSPDRCDAVTMAVWAANDPNAYSDLTGFTNEGLTRLSPWGSGAGLDMDYSGGF